MYTPALVHTYKASKSRLPIGTWINAVAKNLPQFQDDASIYNAVPVNIKIAGSAATSNGNVSVSVAAFEPNWYPTLLQSLAKMTNQPADKIAVVSYLGKPIKDLTSGQLACVGECDIINVSTNKPIRLSAVVAPPLKLATNKTAQLTEWWNGSRDELSRQIALSFKGLSMSELAKETADGGNTHRLIHNYLVGNTLHNLKWDEFARTYGKSSPADAEEIAGQILSNVRKALASNTKQVRDFHAINSEATLWDAKDVTKGGSVRSAKDEFTMYRDIVEDAIFHAMTSQAVIQSIMYGMVRKGQSKPKRNNFSEEAPPPLPRHKREQKGKEDMEEGDFSGYPQGNDDIQLEFDASRVANPVTAYYRDYHQPVHGKIPNHHIEQLNKGYGKAETKYPGDPKRVIELFNLYSGRSVIGCDACGGKKKKKQQRQQRREEEYEPMERKLVPLSAAVARPKKKLVPIDSILPPLVRLDKAADTGASRELPKLVPIDSSARALPKLVPIGSAVVNLPPLIQMGVEDFADDYIPTLDDFM